MCFLWGGAELAKAAFVVAMARGAPCASALRLASLGEVSHKQFEAFQRALPQIIHWGVVD